MNIVEAFLSQTATTEYSGQGPFSSLMLTPRFLASRHAVFLILPRGRSEPVMVAKVPRLPEIGDSVAREVDNLRAIQALRPGGFDTIPRILAFERFHGFPIMLETALSGHLVAPSVVRREPERYTRAVIDWLVDLHQATTPSVDWFETVAARSLGYLRRNLTDAEAPLLAQLDNLLEPLRGAALPLVVEHGDLSHPNLLLLKTGRIGVVDWELSEVGGMLTYDLFFFLSYIAFSLSGSNESGDYLSPFSSAFFGNDAWTRSYIREYADRVGVPSELLRPLFALTWTRYLCNLLIRLRVDESAPAASSTLAQLRENRYYAIWKHTVANIDDIAFP